MKNFTDSSMDIPNNMSQKAEDNGTDSKMAAEDADETLPTPPGRRAQSLLPLPPDGGYGWVIVVACFICNGIVEGSVGSFGIFLPYFTEAFGTSRAKTTIAGSLLIGGFLVSGVVVSGLINCFGCRVVTMVGSLLTVLAFTISTLSPNIDVFITVYGFIGGFGLAMIYLPAMVMVGFYFERRRALATGIAYSGAGIGLVVMAPVCAGLVSAFDWRNALILLAAFPLQGIVLGALMRPLSVPSPSVEDPSETTCTLDSDNDQNALVNGVKPKMSESEPMVRAADVTKLSNRLIGHNLLYVGRSAMNAKAQSMHTLELPLQNHDKHQLEKLSPKNCSMVTQSCMDLPSEPDSRKKSLITHAIQNQNRTQAQQTESTFISCQQLSQLPDDFLRQIDMHKLRDEISKPLARRDIFYSGSVCHLAEYREQPDLRSYIASVTMIPREDMNKPASPGCPCIPKSSLTTLTEMMHLNLLFHPHFLIITLASIFIQLGYFIPIVFIPDYALSLGMPEQNAALLISVIGLANTAGRAGGGALANLPWVNPLHLNNICLILSGIATLLACLVCTTFPLLIIYAAVFGLLMGTFVPLTTIFLVKYLGLHRLNNALGLLSMVKGLSSMAGPPIAGAMLDKNSSHAPVFYFAGSMFITAGCVFYLIPLCSRCTSTSSSTLIINSHLSPECQSLDTKDPEERMV